MNRIWRYAAVLLAAGVAATFAACGSDDDSSTNAATSGASTSTTASTTAGGSDCSGTPLKILTITNASSPTSTLIPEFFDGAGAAAAAVTADCELGAPLQSIDCDDKFTPNGAAACARQAVDEKAIAVVSYSAFGDSIVPILQNAKIPLVSQATSAAENQSPISFPIAYPINAIFGELSIAAGAGAKTVVVATYDIPSVKFFTSLAGAHAKALGMKALPSINFPPTDTDMAPYAGQILDSKADAYIPIMGQPQELALAKALRQQGANITDKPRYISALNQQTPQFMKQVGDTQGLLSWSWALSPTGDPDDPGIQQFTKEMKSAGKATDDAHMTIMAVTGWAGVHMVADTLKGAPDMTPATLIKRFEAGDAPDMTQYAVTPIDFTKPAMPSGPLSKLRLFSTTGSNWEFDADGTPRPAWNGDNPWSDVNKPADLKLSGQ